MLKKRKIYCSEQTFNVWISTRIDCLSVGGPENRHYIEKSTTVPLKNCAILVPKTKVLELEASLGGLCRQGVKIILIVKVQMSVRDKFELVCV